MHSHAPPCTPPHYVWACVAYGRCTYMQVFEEVKREMEGASDKDLGLAIVWRACAVVSGVYIFYLFEMVLRKFTSHSTTQPVSELWGNSVCFVVVVFSVLKIMLKFYL